MNTSNVQVQDKAKVLILGYNPQAHTSYGTIIREVWTRLAKTGKYEIAQQSWFNSAFIHKVPWKLIPTNMDYDANGRENLRGDDKWGQKSLERALAETRPQLVWVLACPYMMHHVHHYRQPFGFKLLQWTCLDGTPIPGSYKGTMQNCDKPLTMAKFSSDALSQMVGYPVDYLHYGVDISMFRPQKREEVIERRLSMSDKLGPDSFVMGWIGKDQVRKRPWINFTMTYYLVTGNYVSCNKCGKITRNHFDPVTKSAPKFADRCRHCYNVKVVRGKPDNKFYLWVHAYNQPELAWDLNKLVADYGLDENVLFTNGLTRDDGIPQDQMPNLYNNFDITLMTTGGEGFGVPAIESQACEVPVAYTDYSCHVELCQKGGIPLEVQELEPESITHIDRAFTSIDHCIKTMLELKKDKQRLKRLGKAGRQWVIENCDIDDVAAKMDIINHEVLTSQTELIGVRT